MKRQITTQKNAHNTSDRSVMRKNLGFSEHSAGDTGLHELTYLGVRSQQRGQRQERCGAARAQPRQGHCQADGRHRRL